MLRFRSPHMTRGFFHGAIVIAVAALVALLSAAAISHSAAKTKVIATHEIAPIDPTCTSSSACIEYDNNGTGSGVRGVSLQGNGLAGTTKNISTSSTTGRGGLFGNDASTSGVFNAGVRGVSVRGEGVAGQSTSNLGVFGISTSSIGVQGTSTNDVGVQGSSTTLYGVQGRTSSSTSSVAGVQGINTSSSIAIRADGFGGPLFVGNSSGGIDTFVVDNSGNTTMGGFASVGGNATVAGALNVDAGVTHGTGTTSEGSALGVWGNNGSFTGSGGTAGVQGSNNTTSIAVRADGRGGNLFVGNSSGGADVFVADNAGNLTITGNLFTSGFCSSGCAVSPKDPGVHVVSYAPREAQPTMEDFGQAQLVSGQTYVRLDPSFANVIDQHANYLVFLTPEGDNRGLYVTQKSLAGFSVRESQGGRSTLTFSYRIIAKPFGPAQPRLARVMLRAQAKPALVTVRPAPLRQVPKLFP